jgi:hypothetical protein
MSVLSLPLNLLWIVFGGLWMAVGLVFAAALMAITIVGLPWTRAAFNIASYTVSFRGSLSWRPLSFQTKRAMSLMAHRCVHGTAPFRSLTAQSGQWPESALN